MWKGPGPETKKQKEEKRNMERVKGDYGPTYDELLVENEQYSSRIFFRIKRKIKEKLDRI